jgi:putative transposase
MPRRPRLILPGHPMHLLQQTVGRQPCFFNAGDYRIYLSWLGEASETADCAIHAYVLMSDHLHLLFTPRRTSSAHDLMQRLSQRHTRYINRTHRRHGPLWQGRFRSCILQPETYLHHCRQYIEQDPVRAGMVEKPEDYPWSSYRANAFGEECTFLARNPLLETCTGTFATSPSQAVFESIRRATVGNYVLGDTNYLKEIERLLGYRIYPRKPGRPRRAASG